MIAPDKAEAIIGNLITMELGNKFIYIEPLLEKLEEFEKLRDESGITFSEFYPRLLDVLDGLSASDGSK